MSSSNDVANFLVAKSAGLTQLCAEDAVVDLFTSNQHGMAFRDRITAQVSSSRRVAKRRRDGQAKLFTGQEAARLILDVMIPKRRWCHSCNRLTIGQPRSLQRLNTLCRTMQTIRATVFFIVPYCPSIQGWCHMMVMDGAYMQCTAQNSIFQT